MKKYALILIFISYLPMKAQFYNDSIFHFELTGTSSAIISIYNHDRYPDATNNATLGYGFFLRSMWHPGKLLSVGIMSGYLAISYDKIKNTPDYYAKLEAVPVQAVVAMQKSNLEAGIGIGTYLLFSTINAGTKSVGFRSELAMTYFAAYHFPLREDIYLSPELRLNYLSFRGIFSILPSLNLRIKLYSYKP